MTQTFNWTFDQASSGFGSALPARLPSPFALAGVPANGLSQNDVFISNSGSDTTGNGTEGSPWATIDKAFDNVSLFGGVIHARGGTYVAGTWDRVGDSTNPVTLRCYGTETVTVTGRLLIATGGQYLRVYGGKRNMQLRAGGNDNVKVQRAQHIELFGLDISNLSDGQGISVGTSATGTTEDIQIWNCLFHTIGTQVGEQHHSVYYGQGTTTGGVIANCVSWDPASRGYQLYTAADGLILTCSVADDSRNTHGMVFGGESSSATDNAKVVNCLFTNNPGRGVDVNWGDFGPGSGNLCRKCLAFANPGGDYDTADGGVTFEDANSADPLYVNAAGRDYRLQPGSPAIAAGDPAYTPAFDFNEDPRVNADIGAFRFV